MPFGWAAAAGAIGSALIGSQASGDAGDATRYATDRSTQLQSEQFGALRGDLAPYKEAGYPALQRLMYLTGTAANDGGKDFGLLTRDFTADDFVKDPGYQFRLAEGEKALGRASAATGNSGNTIGLKALMRYNQDYASNEYGTSYGRFREQQSNKFNMLSYLAGAGQNAAAQTGVAGANMAASSSQALMAGAAGQSSAIMSGGMAWNNAIQGGLGNYMYQQRYNNTMAKFDQLLPKQNNATYDPSQYAG